MNGGIESLIISFCRQIIFIFPFAVLFAQTAKSNPDMSWLLWITFPVAEVLTALVSVFLFRRIWNKK